MCGSLEGKTTDCPHNCNSKNCPVERQMNLIKEHLDKCFNCEPEKVQIPFTLNNTEPVKYYYIDIKDSPYHQSFQNRDEYLHPYIPPLTGLCESCHYEVYHNENQPCRKR